MQEKTLKDLANMLTPAVIKLNGAMSVLITFQAVKHSNDRQT